MGKGGNYNPTGKGGFKDHPENRNNDGAPRKGMSLAEIARGIGDEETVQLKGGKETLSKKVAYVKVLYEEALVNRQPWAFRELRLLIDGLPAQQIVAHVPGLEEYIMALEQSEAELDELDAEAERFYQARLVGPENDKKNGGSGNGNGK